MRDDKKEYLARCKPGPCDCCGDPTARVNTPWGTKICDDTFGLLIELEERYDERLHNVNNNNSSVRST